ncbi:hypothetical protein [Azospirillum argentinense]
MRRRTRPQSVGGCGTLSFPVSATAKAPAPARVEGLRPAPNGGSSEERDEADNNAKTMGAGHDTGRLGHRTARRGHRRGPPSD